MIFINEPITSRNNPTVKFAASLKEKKGRDREGVFIAEGEKLTYEAINAALPLTHIFISLSKAERILPRIRELDGRKEHKNTTVILLEDSTFEKISTENSPQGVISVIKHLDFFSHLDIIYKEEFSIERYGRSIAFCSLRDPGNLGSAIRSAVAFGVDHIILSKDCADVYNPKTVRGAMGSLFRVKITRVESLVDYIKSMQFCNRRVYAAELTEDAVSLNEADFTATDAFIIGNEGHGVAPEVSEACDGSVYIPICTKTESLNASVAAAIFMWEQSKL